MIAIMLALAKCQQVCQIDKADLFYDPECKKMKEEMKDWDKFL